MLNLKLNLPSRTKQAPVSSEKFMCLDKTFVNWRLSSPSSECSYEGILQPMVKLWLGIG